jgi:hypothetical protein
VQWARNCLREEGVIRDDTLRGAWVISDQGRQWLARAFVNSQREGGFRQPVESAYLVLR